MNKSTKQKNDRMVVVLAMPPDPEPLSGGDQQ